MLRETGIPRFSPVVTLLVLVLPLEAVAQMDEITVTARKREENLQEVPVSVSVIGDAEIQRRGIKNLYDITKQVPSIEFDQGFAQSDTRIVIRGLSAITGRQNAAVLVDGIDVSTESISSGGGSTLLLSRLVDVERVEVVKGPQMVQYGRSAFNGAIQYITKDPTKEPEVEFRTDLNDQQHYDASAMVSGPVPVFGDWLGATVTGTWWDDQGLYKNSITNDKVGDDKGYALSMSLLAEPTETLSLKFRAAYQDHKSQPSPIAFLPFDGEIDAPQAAVDSGVVNCYADIANRTLTPAWDDRNARIYDPNFTNYTSLGPFCQGVLPFVAGAVPDPEEAQIRLGTHPFNPGVDYAGFHDKLTRLSLVATWELPNGSFTSWSGFTYDDTSESQDAGEFGVPGMAPYLDANVNLFAFEQDKRTKQYSQEIRYATNFEGPLGVTLGALFWKEDVNNDANSLTVQASGSHCAWFSNSGFTFDDLGFTVDGSGCPGYTELPYAPFVAGGIPFGDGDLYEGISDYRNPSPTNRNTDHWSYYGMLELDVAVDWTLTLEGRYNHEEQDQYGPVFLDPGASGGASNWSVCGIFFRYCDQAFLFHAPGTYSATDTGGPFWSQANFEAAYDAWDPNEQVEDGDPTTYRDVIPDECLQDPNVQARLQALDQGGTDPFDLFNPWCRGRLSRSDSWWSPKVTLEWKVSDDANMYLSWARAHKPGGFATGTIGSNGLNRELAEFEPEKMDVSEIGLKSTWFENTLLFNFAGFFQNYSDKQTVISTLGNDGRPVAKIANANSAEVWGTEIELRWQPISEFLGGNWNFSLLYTGLDTKYVNAEFDSLSTLNIIAAGNCEPTMLTSPATGNQVPACVISYNGNQLEGAPENKVVSSAAYTVPVNTSLDMFVQVDFYWTDKRYVEVSNRSYVDAYSTTDLLLGVSGERWNVTGYVTNLFDDDAVQTAYSGRPSLGCCFVLGSGIDGDDLQPPQSQAVMVDLGYTSTALLAPPRMIGVRASYRFDSF